MRKKAIKLIASTALAWTIINTNPLQLMYNKYMKDETGYKPTIATNSRYSIKIQTSTKD